MKKYIPLDLGFEHYSHVQHNLNAMEYCKILAEVIKPRYAEVPAGEALALYDQNRLVVPDKVRLIWIHDVERPDDNHLALDMAKLENLFGFRASYNIRMVSLATPRLASEIDEIAALGHEIQYQHEDMVQAKRDVELGLELFKQHLAELRQRYPKVNTAFGHGVYGSGIASVELFQEAGMWHPERWQQCGLEHRFGELYCFMDQLTEELADKFHYIGESTYLGADEFVAALRATKPGDVVMFLQHPTWWSDHYDLEELKYIVRESPFFN